MSLTPDGVTCIITQNRKRTALKRRRALMIGGGTIFPSYRAGVPRVVSKISTKLKTFDDVISQRRAAERVSRTPGVKRVVGVRVRWAGGAETFACEDDGSCALTVGAGPRNAIRPVDDWGRVWGRVRTDGRRKETREEHVVHPGRMCHRRPDTRHAHGDGRACDARRKLSCGYVSHCTHVVVGGDGALYNSTRQVCVRVHTGVARYDNNDLRCTSQLTMHTHARLVAHTNARAHTPRHR